MFAKRWGAVAALIMVVMRVEAAVPENARWYISNGSGMLLEETYKTRALRSKYAVSMHSVRPESTPAELRKYYTAPWNIECRILYENGKRTRTQWVFQDAAKISYLIAVVSNDGSGFIEWYDDSGLIVEEQRLAADGSGYFVSYTYRDMYLLKAEAVLVESKKKKEDTQKKDAPPAEQTKSAAGNDGASSAGAQSAEAKSEPAKPAPQPKVAANVRNPDGPVEFPEYFVAASGKEGEKLWTDTYRYTRSLGLRAIERVYHDPHAEQKMMRTIFPRIVPDDSPRKQNFVTPGSSLASNFLQDIFASPAARITYTTDTRRRIVSESRFDSNDNLIGEFTNTWTGERITKVEWKSSDDERVIEFSYNREGNRIGERDYRNGMLERTVTIDKEREVEELYLHGEPALRAVWEDGKKISEERLLNRKY